MITTINEFKKLLLEEVSQEVNSDKEVKLKDYQKTVQEYNANKEKFKSLLISKTEDKWEEEAEKIINGNTYLGLQWKLAKVERNINVDEEKIKNSELTEEEKKEIQTRINDNKKQLSEEKNELSKQIRTDLAEINAM